MWTPRLVIAALIGGLLIASAGDAFAQQDPKKAAKKYRKATVKAPGDPDNWYNLSLALVTLEEWAEADGSTAKLLELDPENARAHFLRGQVLTGLGRPAEGVKALRTAVELDDTFVEALSNLGQAQVAAGQYADGIKTYKKALRAKPENKASFYNNIGDAYFQQGDTGNATKWFKRTVDENPNDATAHFNLGVLFGKLAREDSDFRPQAAASFVRAAELDPRDPMIRFLAGESLLLSGGKDAEARDQLQTCLKLDPSGKKVGDQVHELAKLYLEELGK
ncbi:MAG: tetratricopeptide repeat protein [Acidobacteriota bacterium]